MKRTYKTVMYFLLAAVFTFPHLYKNRDSSKFPLQNRELYDTKLGYCENIRSSINHIDSTLPALDSGKFDTLNYIQSTSNFIKERFYHGTANYTFSENWIANLLGKYVWSHFYAIVIPDDILKRPKGLCSQQTIVFMELLKSRNIKSRKVGITSKTGNGHFLCEVFYGNSWHLYDVNMEPDWNKISRQHQSMDYYLHNKDSLCKVYEDKMPKSEFENLLQNVEYGKTNDFPAKKMRIFQTGTKWLTYLLPVFFLVLGAISLKKSRQNP